MNLSACVVGSKEVNVSDDSEQKYMFFSRTAEKTSIQPKII
ncbi:MAG: hypothetical protein R2779_12440 [Crocinitomicaceae bacterium]